jgi:hypothetical protein
VESYEAARRSLISSVLVLSSCGGSPCAPRAPEETRCVLERVTESGAEVQSPNAVGTDAPVPRYGADAVSYQGALFVVGGSAPSGFLGTVDRFDPDSGTWTVVADGLVERRFLSAVVHGRHMFVMGGYDESNTAVIAVERVDLETGEVTEVAPLPRPRYSADAVAREGQIYVAGGVLRGERLDVVDRYDIAQNVWRESPSVGAPRDMRLVQVDGEVYALGGYSGDDRPTVTMVERLDPSTGRWVPVGDMPCTTAFSAASLGTFVITFGDYEDLGRVLLFDSATEQWSALHPQFTPRRHSAATTIGDRVYVFGGNTASRDSWSNRLEVYELSCASDP